MLPLMMLAFESGSVITLRTLKFITGDGDAINEVQLMVREKVDAAFEASASLMAGASADAIIDRYRQHVAANADRLGNHTR